MRPHQTPLEGKYPEPPPYTPDPVEQIKGLWHLLVPSLPAEYVLPGTGSSATYLPIYHQDHG